MRSKPFIPFTIFCLFVIKSYCQEASFDTLLNRAKSEFKRDSSMQSYGSTIQKFNQIVALRPDNTEAHYFLAYCYSRNNSGDANTIPSMKMQMVVKASNELETVIKLSPYYSGESIVLDPYSKISSEWGSLALSYISNGKTDSAIWALNQGRKRGGFDDFILSECEMTLNSCSKNAVLITSGDNYFFPILYLQTIKKIRNDVQILDVGLVSSNWYPSLLAKKGLMSFDIKGPELDTVNYRTWHDSTIIIPIDGTTKSFKWVMKPSYDNQYILRGDRVLLSFLKENKFKRDVYFTKGFIEDEQLSLTDNLIALPAVDKLNAKNESEPTDEEFEMQFKELVKMLRLVNKNSPDEFLPTEYLRISVADRIKNDLQNNNKKLAANWLKLLDEYVPVKDYPFPSCSESTEKYLEGLREKL